MARIMARLCWVTTSTRPSATDCAGRTRSAIGRSDGPCPGGCHPPPPMSGTAGLRRMPLLIRLRPPFGKAPWTGDRNGRQERATWRFRCRRLGSRRLDSRCLGSRRSGATASRLQTVCSPDVYGAFERWGSGKQICAGLFRWDRAADCLLRPDRSAAVDNGLRQPDWHEKLPCDTC